MSDPEMVLSDILTYIERAEQSLAANDAMALAEMNALVDDLLQKLRMMTPPQVKEYMPEIEHLMARLSALTGGMASAQQQVGDAIGALSNHNKAARAYLSTPAE
jgi:hypothetical protein